MAAVSFTFGLPPERAIEQLHAAGSEVWLTVTSPQEARQAADAGADALIVQGVEAGGHRGVFVDDDSQSELTLPPYSSRARARRKSVPPTCWPPAYPEIHHLPSPLRAHGRAAGDPDLINLWAGQAHLLADTLPAEEITRRLAQDARDAITAAQARLR